MKQTIHRLYDYIKSYWHNLTVQPMIDAHCNIPLTKQLAYQFWVGDEIGNEQGGCRIRIAKMDGSFLEAVVVAADDFWTDGIKYKAGQKDYFIVGETIKFENKGDNFYDFIYPNRCPWFILGINKDGKKYFEHYR
jgi:hypothetical protein